MHKCAWILLTCLAATEVSAADDPHAADRELLRGMLAEVEAALNARDLSAVLPLLTDEVVITYQNAEVSRGKAEAVAYYRRMMEGAAAVVKDFRTKASVSAPAVFYGDVAVAYGTTDERYALSEGIEFTLHANWSTTLIRRGGEWKVAAIHFSTNLFDNALLRSAQRLTWLAAALALALGLAVGIGACWLRRRTRA